MIVLHDAHSKMPQTPQESPPAYDEAVAGGSSTTSTPLQPIQPSPQKGQPLNGPQGVKPPSRRSAFVNGRTAPAMPQTTVFHYTNPNTGEQVASLLPPGHPEMVCLQQGGHISETKYGILGILAAIVWFPLGIGLCLLDRRVKCKRCGYVIDDGMCG
ncbi:hypothetical protein SERLA73DRAFT_180631 [Serpula lacrymans var. lacrymans S7.3]|uniref:Uncharacterized protein n=2 Tax=Serpula lacrymans var. lacrymans TaxID=341189 RepID=F8PVQ2_SERL3|nr:uncharacterized protein SERLADRAFT_466318 [Serpula lacrymans var. lacrymans S7.9]EGO00186.1 hypothetical protein SERLA73DRAFT_180631 [Serpula lacrymans var. lacrymans S7.3]EGO25743.1 hypothetical protein SERLADRAFT_466318 [Serpula lacrymans var. lacrymans S7.9]